MTDKTQLEEDPQRFQEWLMRGPGESIYGGMLKAAASHDKQRIEKRLATPNLFPHIEHEDRAALEKAHEIWQEGEKRVKRCRARKVAIDGLLDADAGLKISAADLEPT